MDTATILEKAADIVDERGLCRYTFEFHGRVCAMGAVCFVMHGDTNANAHRQTVFPVSWTFARIAGQQLVVFNDDSRSQEEVTSKLRSVAAIIRAQASEPVREAVAA